MMLLDEEGESDKQLLNVVSKTYLKKQTFHQSYAKNVSFFKELQVYPSRDFSWFHGWSFEG